jgi:hypothetical protein
LPTAGGARAAADQADDAAARRDPLEDVLPVQPVLHDGETLAHVAEDRREHAVTAGEHLPGDVLVEGGAADEDLLLRGEQELAQGRVGGDGPADPQARQAVRLGHRAHADRAGGQRRRHGQLAIAAHAVQVDVQAQVAEPAVGHRALGQVVGDDGVPQLLGDSISIGMRRYRTDHLTSALTSREPQCVMRLPGGAQVPVGDAAHRRGEVR